MGAVGASKALTVNSSFLTVFIMLGANKVVFGADKGAVSARKVVVGASKFAHVLFILILFRQENNHPWPYS